jgi:hypothetical protein
MPKKLKIAVFLMVAAMSTAHAEPPSSETPTLLTALSSCKSSFFSTLHAQKNRLAKVTTIMEKSDSVAWITVLDRSRNKSNSTRFSSPYEDGPFKLSGYFDEVDNFGPAGLYYSWGFFVPGSVRQVAEQVRPFVQDSARLREDGGVFVRSELWVNGQWSKNDGLKGGTIPAQGTVERVFLIEDGAPEWPGYVRVGCSLQGNISPELLRLERPDL